VFAACGLQSAYLCGSWSSLKRIEIVPILNPTPQRSPTRVIRDDFGSRCLQAGVNESVQGEVGHRFAWIAPKLKIIPWP